MLVHRELIALVIVAFSATTKVAASSTSSRHLRGPGTEFEDLLAVFVEEDEEERHLSALPPPEGSTYAPTPTPEPAECNQPCSDDEVCARESPNARARCYTKCSKNPFEDTCTGNHVCVSTLFDCQGSANVFNLFCECQQSEGSYLCLHSDCGLIRQ